jgi:hypothetical protein
MAVLEKVAGEKDRPKLEKALFSFFPECSPDKLNEHQAATLEVV